LPSAENIALVDLQCSAGLPGAKNVDIAASLALLDEMTQKVKAETERLWPRFHKSPAEFYDSKGYYRMLVLLTVVQQDFGIHYNPARITDPSKPEPDEIFYADSADSFLHGALGPRRSGTCASLPVLYAAIGRKLGYPIKLVHAKAHLFLRWDDGAEKINLETSGRGLSVYPDDHYRQWPLPMTAEEEKGGFFLKNLTPEEELAGFLQNRAMVLMIAKRYDEAREALKLASKAAPHWSHLDGMFMRNLDFAQYGPPKPMVVGFGEPRIVGPYADGLRSIIEHTEYTRELLRRREQARLEAEMLQLQRPKASELPSTALWPVVTPSPFPQAPQYPNPHPQAWIPGQPNPAYPHPQLPGYPNPATQHSTPGLPQPIRLP
jgi:hypothetical protein